MNFQQAGDLLKMIRDKHSPLTARNGARMVKYVHPSLDMRTGHCFALTLRGYGWEQTFHTQNECRDLPESLFDRVVTFLKEPLPGVAS
jgi:hypothetical protein